MPLTRRHFTQLSAATLAAARLTPGALAQSTPDRRIGYAVVGCGRIADHFLRGTAQSAHSRITALVSGHRDKAERIAAQYNVPTTSIYSYEDLSAAKPSLGQVAFLRRAPQLRHAELPPRRSAEGASSARSPWTSPPPSAAV